MTFITPSDALSVVELKTTEAYEVRMTLAGDTIVFHMHTNVFAFPESHMIHKSPYVSGTRQRIFVVLSISIIS